MFRTYRVIAIIGLQVLVADCSDESPASTGPGAGQPPRAAIPALATTASRLQFRELAVIAAFPSLDPTGCVETDVFISAAEQTRKPADSLTARAPGKPATGLFASVSVSQVDFCTGNVLRAISSETADATFQVDRTKLAGARLQATIPGFDFIRNTEVQVEVDIAWTATGGLVSSSEHSRVKQPGLLVSFSSKGGSREADASGTVTVEGENFTPSAAGFAAIFRARRGELSVVRSR